MIDFEYRGGKYSLYMNGYAYFAAKKKFGEEKSLLEVMEPDTKEGLEATVWLLCEFARQGEMYRRFLGEDRGQYPEYSKTVIQVQPFELPFIKAAVIQAIAEGFGRENPSPEDCDPWLAELEAENAKKKHSPRRSIFTRLLKGSASESEKGCSSARGLSSTL